MAAKVLVCEVAFRREQVAILHCSYSYFAMR